MLDLGEYKIELVSWPIGINQSGWSVCRYTETCQYPVAVFPLLSHKGFLEYFSEMPKVFLVRKSTFWNDQRAAEKVRQQKELAAAEKKSTDGSSLFSPHRATSAFELFRHVTTRSTSHQHHPLPSSVVTGTSSSGEFPINLSFLFEVGCCSFFPLIYLIKFDFKLIFRPNLYNSGARCGSWWIICATVCSYFAHRRQQVSARRYQRILLY